MQFSSAPGLDVIAPGLLQQEWRDAEAFGAATWLWMHARTRRETPVKWLSTLLLPPIAQRQFLLASEGGRPVFYLSWAHFSEAAEHRYVYESHAEITAADWSSGDRMWIVDWIAPFGHTRAMQRLLKTQLLASKWARSLYHHGTERGLRIKTFRGDAVDPVEADAWFAAHPVVHCRSADNFPRDCLPLDEGVPT